VEKTEPWEERQVTKNKKKHDCESSLGCNQRWRVGEVNLRGGPQILKMGLRIIAHQVRAHIIGEHQRGQNRELLIT